MRTMSFSVSDYEPRREETNHCPSCGTQHRISYVMIPCGHPGCKVTGCGDCLIRCEGDQFRCEDHFMAERIGNGLIFYTFPDFQEMAVA